MIPEQLLLSDVQKVSQELKTLLTPDPPKDSVFTDIVGGKVIVPQVVFQTTMTKQRAYNNPWTNVITTLSHVLPSRLAQQVFPSRMAQLEYQNGTARVSAWHS
jgi:hypothetical protein